MSPGRDCENFRLGQCRLERCPHFEGCEIATSVFIPPGMTAEDYQDE